MNRTKQQVSRWQLRSQGLVLFCCAVAFAAIVASVVAIAAEAAAKTATKSAAFYVAPDGNDQWSGKSERPNQQKTDGPFAAVTRARDAVRELKRQQGGTLQQQVTVFLRQGQYFLNEPVVLTPEDSGTKECPVVFAAFPKETPVISGGRRITGWKQVTVNGRALWAADLPAVRAGQWFFRQVWVDGQRRTRARHPNHDYLAVEAIPDAKSDLAWSEGQSRFRFKAGDLKSWSTVTNAEVCVMNRWVESHLPVISVDESERLVAFSKRSVFKLDPGDLYYMEHAFEALDVPGEWYLDRAAGALYYLPLPGEDMSRATVIAPVLSQLIRLEGKSEAGQFIDQVVFRGLTFSHTEWYFPTGFNKGRDKVEVSPPPKPEIGGFSQAAVGVPGAVRGEGVRQGVFEDCTFAHLGNYALELGRGCRQNRVAGCEIFDLGAGGIKIGETAIRNADAEIARENQVSDCHIHHGGRIFHSAIGVWIGQSPGNRIVHSHIHDFYYTGISIGWTWGYGRALATNNLVEFNHIHHIGVQSDGDGPILSDMGGIYTLGLHTGTVIRNNLWHDFAGFRYGGWGIYFDEGTTGILAENNVVYRSTHGGFHQHYGKENIVRNNIFAYARDHQIQRSRVEPHRSFTFERNIVLWRQGATLGGNFSDANFGMNRNLYWREGGGDILFAKLPFDAWQKNGKDMDSRIADPKFVDPQKDNFTLQPDSPAFELGFKAIDLQGVGVRR